MDWHEHFIYDPNTGTLYWKERRVEHFKSYGSMKAWNTLHANKAAGCKACRFKTIPAYVTVSVLGRSIGAHRVIWEMINGPIPTGMFVDHIDGNPWNNKIDNLRLATPSQNNMNQALSKRSTTGYKGVCPGGPRTPPFRACIRIKGKSKLIGFFHTAEEAHEAYKKRASELFGEFKRYK